MKGNYNSIASYYDRLSKIVFGRAIVNAQQFLIDFIRPGSTVLIVGGGTGWMLEEITKKHSSGLNITYIEASEKMMELSQKRDFCANKVDFINRPIQEVQLKNRFDTVITSFLFDNFSAATSLQVFKQIDDQLLVGGSWLFCDFQLKDDQLWQKLLLKLMYSFFKLTCNIEADRLPDTNTLFDRYHYKKKLLKTFYHDFICSSVFRKEAD